LFRKRHFAIALTLLLQAVVASADTGVAPGLESGWTNPPVSARLRAYWWWLNGNVTREAITRDLEEMKAKGFGGAVIVDAGGAEQFGNGRVPHGPTFFSPEWRALYKHALHEADRLGLEMSLNVLSGWNLGGPMVTPDDTIKKVTWSEIAVDSTNRLEVELPLPNANDHFYRDVCVLALPIVDTNLESASLENFEVKALLTRPSFQGTAGWFLANSAPETARFLLEDKLSQLPSQAPKLSQVLDITSHFSPKGILSWSSPPGRWRILRFGYTLGDVRRVSTCSDGWDGYALDVLDEGALRRYWDAVIDPLIADAGPLAGKTLKYLHTDSWEVESFNWTPSVLREFQRRRGYDAKRWLPVLAGYIISSRQESRRFLDDFRRTLGDLAADNHYRPFSRLAAQHGIGLHCESGGPHFTPIDAQQCLGIDDMPMSEFWARSATHRTMDETRFFVKQPASAAHTMGHRYVAGEGFTSVGPHWQETLWDNLKPSFDQALCEGLNVLVWHAFVCSPAEMGMPGQQYFAGTHFNPKTTWWSKSAPFLSYIDRSQFLLQQGLFVADVCYYYGDHVPNYTQLKHSDPAHVQPGFDYDVISQEGLLTRLSVRNGRLVLPDGMSYRALVLPNRNIISLPVLRKVRELVSAGATVIGQKPTEASGLTDYPRCDVEVKALADELWAQEPERSRIVSDRPVREVLLAQGVRPDFEAAAIAPSPQAVEDPKPMRLGPRPSGLDYVHRATETADIYFVSSRSGHSEDFSCTFRVAGHAPEIWNPVSGTHAFAVAYEEKDGRTTLPLHFNPCGSYFVVFREPAGAHPAVSQRNTPEFQPLQEINGSWTVHFDPVWGGPDSVQFDSLGSWTTRPECGVKYYSGTATYKKMFDLPRVAEKAGNHLWLDLGNVHELAEVRLNGKSLGIVWAPPFRVEITSAAKPASNLLEVEVVNFWPNRIIGDQSLPKEQRFTHTNVRKLTKATPLMESGLLGPVRLLEEHQGAAGYAAELGKDSQNSSKP
jgi:hypothetical protein